MVRLLTPEELGNVLGVSVHTIYQWTSKRQIPFMKVGKLIRFSEMEIQKWLEANKLETHSRLLERLKTSGTNLSKR
jgi:excisionase family DNA binding protein